VSAGSTDCALVGLQGEISKLEQPRQYSYWVGQRSERSLQLNLPVSTQLYPSGFLEVPQKTTPNRYLPKLELTAVA